MIDTHAHLFVSEFGSDLDLVIERAQQIGVTRFLLPNVDESTVDAMLAVCERYKTICSPMMGIHPTSVSDTVKEQIAFIEKQLTLRSYCAIGEIGLDLYWDTSKLKEQIQLFQAQLHIANSLKLPVCIHIRNAFDETFAALKSSGLTHFSGVFHCFSGTEDQAKQAIDLGFVLGIGGPITYKKSTLPTAIANIPLSAIVLETDSPYLAPQTKRGKRNEPSYLAEVVTALSRIYETDDTEVVVQTTKNVFRVFPIQ